MIFGSVESLECYCAHLLLSEDEIYFTVLETKGSRSIYGPRSAEQVHLYLVRDNGLFGSSNRLHMLALG